VPLLEQKWLRLDGSVVDVEVAASLRRATKWQPFFTGRDRSCQRAVLRGPSCCTEHLSGPLHLLKVPEEWDAFIARLLDWIEDPRGDGGVFAAYTACYYLDSLDTQSWQGMSDPFSIERAWTEEALHAVLEESYKNLDESWYRAPHHAVINTLRALNYLRAHPNLMLGHREKIVCRCLARAGIAAASQLSHPRVSEVRRWCEWLERELVATSRRV
jgi:hypothetical protein